MTECKVEHRNNPEKPRQTYGDCQICSGCSMDVERQLRTLSTFDEDVDRFVLHSALGQSAGGGPISGSKEPPLVISGQMSQHKIDVADILAAIVTDVGTGRNIRAAQRVQVRTGNIKAFCDFLGVHHSWTVTQPWATDYATEVLKLGRRAYGLLNPNGTRRFTHEVMRCLERDDDNLRCQGNVWALLTPADPYAEAASEMICDLCGFVVELADWLDYGQKVRKAMEAA